MTNDLELLLSGTSGFAIIDFDQTLFLENSSEQFLIAARPKVLIFFVFKFLVAAFKLRNFFIDVPPRSAEAAVVRFIIRFLPWNYRRWQRAARDLFQEHENAVLCRNLKSLPEERIVICSNGYDELVMPLIAGSRWERCRLSFVPLFSRPDVFRQSKVDRLEAMLDADDVRKSIFVTDSEDDLDLLNHVDHPCLVTWNEAVQRYDYVPRYMPLSYTFFAKFPWQYTLEQMFFVDYAILFMALIFAAVNIHFGVMAGATCLFLSFYSMYEIGYYENDFDAAKLEDKPSTRKQSERFYGSHVVARAIMWSVLFGVAGCWLVGGVDGTYESSLRNGAVWAAVLGALYVTFKLYNRMWAERRVKLYVCLQSIKYFSIYFIVPPVKQGMILALSQIIMMSSRYIAYRLGGRVVEFASDDVRANFFVVFSVVYCLFNIAGLTRYDLIVFVVMGTWCAVRVVLSHLRAKMKRYKRDRAQAAAQAQ